MDPFTFVLFLTALVALRNQQTTASEEGTGKIPLEEPGDGVVGTNASSLLSILSTQGNGSADIPEQQIDYSFPNNSSNLTVLQESNDEVNETLLSRPIFPGIEMLKNNWTMTIFGQCMDLHMVKWTYTRDDRVIFSTCTVSLCDGEQEPMAVDCLDATGAKQGDHSLMTRLINVFYGYFPKEKLRRHSDLKREIKIIFDQKCLLGKRVEAVLETIGDDICTVEKCDMNERDTYYKHTYPTKTISCEVLKTATFGHGKETAAARKTLMDLVQ